MRRVLLIITALMLANIICAQQRPHYTQYILNNYILNPALSGIENYTDVKISARDQWVGLNGAPRTTYLTIHGPIGKKDYKTSATSFNIPGENPRGSAYWETYTASEPHHGLGMSIINDKTGNFSRFTANISYAYHIGLNPKTNISAGFSTGLSQIYRDMSKSDFGGGEPYDPAQAKESGIRRLKPDLNAGLWLYNSDYFIGASVQQAIPQKISFVDNAVYGGKLIPHYFLSAGYRFLLNEDINMIPSFMLKYVSYTPTNPQFDINVKWQYRDVLWAGGSYRLNDGYAALLGFNLGNTFNLGYAYDFTKTPVNTASNGTHEIILGFLINNKYGDTCPRNVW
ncbi:type IX secretion system membrane protein PorP/SprF [Chitinophagaceae bacterium LB-8]|uniref:Type IX secretion system membrane protein PorP/SprF n=1 Tax=Paraflavisolibacter caeni TaxID=2982496 RepID=A0A9X3BHT7_9BACT|nr:type IX secretion system membrane protein PorP/SprF [Paraflavisolibacter caeni]MCU7549158.1 type IX secretion system membrane protein PorP/SprF [Paraflavisolibacter caeni]